MYCPFSILTTCHNVSMQQRIPSRLQRQSNASKILETKKPVSYHTTSNFLIVHQTFQLRDDICLYGLLLNYEINFLNTNFSISLWTFDLKHFSPGKEEQAAKAKATHRSTLSILMDFLVMTFCISDGFVDRLSVVRRHTCCVVAVSNVVVSNRKSTLAFVYVSFITIGLRK